ncbi:MAG: N-acetylmuramoyl-L-alanine amidase [Bifidobacteriaceae bacterium]|jgi:hypothetical protein|nr:N-acetylmuramoyl-L-alanine amidase [Bifidobacteriaceae bacterium]
MPRIVSFAAIAAMAVLGLAPPAGADPPPLADSLGAASPDQVAQAVAGALEELAQPAAALDPLGEQPPEAVAPVAQEVGQAAVLEAGPAGAAELFLPSATGAVAAFVTAPLGAREFSVAGVTWQGGPAPGRVLARAYQAGEWTDWYDLEADGGPDPGSAEGGGAAGASGPLVAAGATGLQIQVLSQAGQALPQAIGAAVVPLAAVEAAGPAGGLAAAAAGPAIQPRSAWGAAPADYSGNTPKGQPELAAQLKGAIIHHQAGSNTYTQAQVPGIIRSIQSWHMGNNGWNDIGYNFLVDKFGGIWEGRQGGVTLNVVGAHATNFNTGSTGVCLLGDLDKVEPTAEALQAAGQVVAWRLSLAGITNLKGSTVYPNDPKQATQPVVAGHRDVQATTCPGRYLYAKLDQLRNHEAAAPEPAPAAELKVWTTVSPDLTGDGRGDIVVIDGAGRLWVYPMASAAALGPRRQIGNGWQGWSVVGPGDWNKDGYADLMGVAPNGDLYLYPGPGFSRKTQVGNGWTGYTVRPSGDIDGDGNADVLAIDDQTQLLYLYRGNGQGGWVKGGRKQVGNGWAGYDLHAAGRVNPDKLADIFSIDAAGYLYTYLAKPGGGFKAKVRSGNGWNGFTLHAGSDMTGDGLADLVGLDQATGSLYVYRGLGDSRFAMKRELAQNW